MLILLNLALCLGGFGFGLSAAGSAELLYHFPNYLQYIENLVVRPSGEIIITTFDEARIYLLDPVGTEEPQLLAQLPDADAAMGIADLGQDTYAVVGGYINKTDYSLHGTGIIDKLYLSCWAGAGPVPTTRVASYTQPKLPNGAVALPSLPHIFLSADSMTGTIYRINTVTGFVDVALQDPELAPMKNPDPFLALLGVNGLKVQRDFLYVSSSGGQFLARIHIDNYGNPLGSLEKLVEWEMPQSPDDFTIANDGTIYVALPPNSVARITPERQITYLVKDDDSLERPTSIALSHDEKTVYIATGGTNTDGGRGGQIFAIEV